MSEALPTAEELRAATRWQPPRLAAPDAPVPAAHTALHTAAELDALEESAWQEGFARGQADGYSAGFATGLQQVREEAQRLRSLVEHAARPLAQLDQALEHELVQLALAVAQRLVQDQLAAQPAQVVALVRGALAALNGGAAEVRVLLHPDDLPLVEQQLSPPPEIISLRLLADASLARGDCRLLSDGGHIDGRLTTRIAQLQAELIGEGG